MVGKTFSIFAAPLHLAVLLVGHLMRPVMSLLPYTDMYCTTSTHALLYVWNQIIQARLCILSGHTREVMHQSFCFSSIKALVVQRGYKSCTLLMYDSLRRKSSKRKSRKVP